MNFNQSEFIPDVQVTPATLRDGLSDLCSVQETNSEVPQPQLLETHPVTQPQLSVGGYASLVLSFALLSSILLRK